MADFSTALVNALGAYFEAQRAGNSRRMEEIANTLERNLKQYEIQSQAQQSMMGIGSQQRVAELAQRGAMERQKAGDVAAMKRQQAANEAAEAVARIRGETARDVATIQKGTGRSLNDLLRLKQDMDMIQKAQLMTVLGGEYDYNVKKAWADNYINSMVGIESEIAKLTGNAEFDPEMYRTALEGQFAPLIGEPPAEKVPYTIPAPLQQMGHAIKSTLSQQPQTDFGSTMSIPGRGAGLSGNYNNVVEEFRAKVAPGGPPAAMIPGPQPQPTGPIVSPMINPRGGGTPGPAIQPVQPQAPISAPVPPSAPQAGPLISPRGNPRAPKLNRKTRTMRAIEGTLQEMDARKGVNAPYSQTNSWM